MGDFSRAAGNTNSLKWVAGTFIVLVGILFLPSPSFGMSTTATFANNPSPDAPSISINLTPSDTVRQGTEIAANLTMGGLEQNLDVSTLIPPKYKFRVDVVDHDSCEGTSTHGYSMGTTHGIYLVDEYPEQRWVTVSPSCPAGNYTLRATLYDSLDSELDTVTATFSVVEPPLAELRVV